MLPRLKERDPFKVLGIPPDSDFEEVMQARNYLVGVCCLVLLPSIFTSLLVTLCRAQFVKFACSKV